MTGLSGFFDLYRKVFHFVGEPQARCLRAICGHTQTALGCWIEGIEQVGIHADSDNDSEIAGGSTAGKILVLDSADSNAAGLCGESGPGCALYRKRDP